MNRSELIAALAEHKGLKHDEATALVEAFFDSIKEALLAGNRVESWASEVSTEGVRRPRGASGHSIKPTKSPGDRRNFL